MKKLKEDESSAIGENNAFDSPKERLPTDENSFNQINFIEKVREVTPIKSLLPKKKFQESSFENYIQTIDNSASNCSILQLLNFLRDY